jgi:hypothetical protein
MADKVIVGNSGMKIQGIVDEGRTERGKLVGIPGHWEDGAALMWDTVMKKLGLEPYKGDAQWNKLIDSRGNQLFGTQKSAIGGIWLRWKKPIQSNIDDSLASEDLKASLQENVSVAERSSDCVWNHEAVADLFLDGFLKKDFPRKPPGLVSFTSTVIFATTFLEDSVKEATTEDERSACSKVLKACLDLLDLISFIPGESTGEMLHSAISKAEKLCRLGAAVAGVAAPADRITPIFGGREDDFLKLISQVVKLIKSLQEGDVALVPCGWLRKGGDSHMMVIPFTPPLSLARAL